MPDGAPVARPDMPGGAGGRPEMGAVEVEVEVLEDVAALAIAAPPIAAPPMAVPVMSMDLMFLMWVSFADRLAA
jgi:hypothetical protein